MNNNRVFKRQTGQACWILLVLMLCAGRLSAQNLFSNPGFEAGTTGWSGNSSATFTSSTVKSHSGSRSAYLTNRTATWNGIVQSVAGVLQNTNTYYVSAWVLIDNATNQSVNLTLQKNDASGLSYTHIAACTGNSNTWTQMTGNFTLNIVGALTNLTIYIEGPGSNVSFYADDFVLTNVPPYDWKPLANARIEQFRKRDVRVQITDSNGLAVAGAAIQVRQTKHQFAFGTAINGTFLIRNTLRSSKPISSGR